MARDFSGGQMARDMTLFLDDDGNAYHIYASEENDTLQVASLTSDWLRHDGRYTRILPGLANEAPAVFKSGGRYFMFASGTTSWRPNPARLYVADHVFGPWRSLGNPVRGTPQQVATTFNGQSTHVFALPGKTGPLFVFMADSWHPDNAIDGRYIWLPIDFEDDGSPVLHWREHWRPDIMINNRLQSG